jgi:hypothetical protein
MAPALEPELAGVLQALIEGVRPILAANYVGAYLQGSFAVGDADDSSDVDFILVVNDDVPESQVEALQAVHVRVYDLDSNWAKHLEGAYFPRGWLADPAADGRPLLYVDNGSRVLERSAHDNTLVVRWVLWQHGVRLEGPDLRTLLGPVPPDALRAEVATTMRLWAGIVAANPAEVDNGWYQPYAVVSYCRMLHTLAAGRVVSKRTGALWAQQALDPRWAGLIQRGLEKHAGQWARVSQRADPADLASTYEFISYVVAQIDSLLRQNPEAA